jgi:DNA-binding IclR family transcriptional regulator
MTDPSDLRPRLQRIQLEGNAWTNGEYAEGIASVAAAIADASGEAIAAVHVHGPSYRFPPAGREAALGLQVTATATRIARTLRQAPG